MEYVLSSHCDKYFSITTCKVELLDPQNAAVWAHLLTSTHLTSAGTPSHQRAHLLTSVGTPSHQCGHTISPAWAHLLTISPAWVHHLTSAGKPCHQRGHTISPSHQCELIPGSTGLGPRLEKVLQAGSGLRVGVPSHQCGHTILPVWAHHFTSVGTPSHQRGHTISPVWAHHLTSMGTSSHQLTSMGTPDSWALTVSSFLIDGKVCSWERLGMRAFQVQGSGQEGPSWRTSGEPGLSPGTQALLSDVH